MTAIAAAAGATGDNLWTVLGLAVSAVAAWVASRGVASRANTADSKADAASVTIPTATGADVRVDLTGVPVALAQSVAALSETLRGALTRIATLEGEVIALEDDLRRTRDDRTALARALRDYHRWAQGGATPPAPGLPARVADLLDRA